MDPVWEHMHSTRSWGKYPAVDLVQTVMRSYRSVESRQRSKAVELGCGAGANLSFLLNEGFQVYGFDGAPSAIRNAEKRLRPSVQEGQTLELTVCQFEDMDFPAEQFDITIDYLSTCCVPLDAIRATYEKIHGILKPGGRHYFRAFGTKTLGANTGERIEPGTVRNPECGPCRNMGVIHFFELKELRDMFGSWSDCRISNLTERQVADPDDAIEEWVVWAQK